MKLFEPLEPQGLNESKVFSELKSKAFKNLHKVWDY